MLEEKETLKFGQIWSIFSWRCEFWTYREQFQKYFLKILNITKYTMHQGFAIQDLNNSSDLLLMLDYGIFYEFIPMDTFGTQIRR
jgi:hypothetical protein